MNRCFVIQPFDKGDFDKRYEATYKPAIIDAGLEPYRVDEDLAINVPIKAIENQIRNAKICFADITIDNPNVWFELGFAFAAQKEVVIVCSNERKQYPFDVQHRTIIKYRTGALQYFNTLKNQITERLKAILKKTKNMQQIIHSPIKEDALHLSDHELVALASLMENGFLSEQGVNAITIQQDMNNAGYTALAASVALKSLMKKKMASMSEEEGYHGDTYLTYQILPKGEEWLLNNIDKLALKNDTPVEQPPEEYFNNDDEIPF